MRQLDLKSKYIFFVLIPIMTMGPLALLHLVLIEKNHHYYWLFFIGWVLFHGIGQEVVLHRIHSHRMIKIHKITDYILSSISLFSGQNSPLFWSHVHNHHHANPDQDGDPHSPANGKWHALFLWYFSSTNLATASDQTSRHLYRSRFHRFIHRNYSKIYTLSVLVVFIISWKSALYLFILPAWVSLLMVGLVNMICHDWNPKRPLTAWQTRPFETKDASLNLAYLAPFTWGLSLHNNHHNNPFQKKLGLNKYEIDGAYWLIRCIEYLDQRIFFRN